MRETKEQKRLIFFDTKDLYLCLALAALSIGLYAQVIGFDFINYDDPMYILGNKDLENGITWDAVKFAFTSFYACNYHPLTWLSHMVDIELFGLNAGMHHVVNVIFHAINSVLLYLALKRMTSSRYRSAIVAALFALHPLHVESVAWVSERKDVLSTFFWMLTMLAYASFAEKKGCLRYGAVVIAFTLGLLSKPMLVTLPFVLILLDYWPLGRIAFGRTLPDNADSTANKVPYIPIYNLIIEKLPLFILVLGAVVVTVVAQNAGGAVRTLDMMPIGLRIENAIVSYGTYFIRTFWPLDLSVFYPYFRHIPVWKVLASGIFLFSATVLSLVLARRFPYLPVGWFWYLGTLVPVIGIVQVGSQAHADRYTYIPLIGIFILVAWGAAEAIERWRGKRVLFYTLPAVILAVLSVLTWIQVGYWKSDYTLFSHSLEVTNNFLGHNSLGNAHLRDKNYDEAIRHFKEALKMKPTDERVHITLGVALFEKGIKDEAMFHYQKALEIAPDNPNAHYNYAVALESKGMPQQALYHYRQVLRYDPDHRNALNNIAFILAQEGKTDEAISYYRKAKDIDHGLTKAYVNIALLLTKERKYTEALTTMREALERSPNDMSLFYVLGCIYQQMGDYDRSIESYRRALSLGQRSPEVLQSLGYAYHHIGKDEDAVTYLIALTKIQPNNPDNLYNVACLYSQMNNIPEALHYLELAVSKGFRNWALMKTDKDLKNIRNTDAFRKYIQGKK